MIVELEKKKTTMLKPYTALYRTDELRAHEAPLAFVCQAEDGDHAVEQCENAYPDGEVVWVVPTGTPAIAYDDYYAVDVA